MLDERKLKPARDQGAIIDSRPPRRHSSPVRRWHRRLGLMSAVVVVLLVLTGWALNHTGGLELARRQVSSDWLIDWYGIGDPVTIDSYAVENRILAWIDGNLYLDDELIGQLSERPAGIVGFEGLFYIISTSMLMVYSAEGLLVERIHLEIKVRRIGLASDGGVVLDTESGQLELRLDTLESVANDKSNHAWLTPMELDDKAWAELAALHNAHFITMERLLLDVHSGRILGKGGVWIMDAFAFIFLVLAVSGFIVWFKARDVVKGKRHRHKC